MEWEKQLPPPQPQQAEELGGGMFVKVMTDEQMEILRKQIAVYATICEQLVDLHKSIASQHDLTGPLSLSVFLFLQFSLILEKKKMIKIESLLYYQLNVSMSQQ